MRLRSTVTLAALLLATASHADTGYSLFLVGGTGFAYEYDVALNGPDPHPDSVLAIGDGFALAGYITGTNTCYLNVDYNTDEYTFLMDGLRVEQSSVYQNIHLFQFAPGGRMRIYRDDLATGSPAAYGTHPPNATTPASFTDGDGHGTLVLGGPLRYAVLTYNSSFQYWDFSTEVAWTEGALLPFIPEFVRPYGIIGAFMQTPAAGMPEGFLAQAQFESRLDQDTCTPVPARTDTWGRLKAIYR